MKVLLTHPGIQYAHQLAWALEDAGDLQLFCSGVPVTDPSSGRQRLWGPELREIPVPVQRRRHYVLFPLLRRFTTRFVPATRANAINHWLDGAFDRWTAKWVRKLKPDMVVCYENSALHTFAAAKEHKAICVLDAASIHYESGLRLGGDAVRQDPEWVHKRKREEVLLADAILTCSELAAQTYVEAGVPAERVFPVPLGTMLPSGIDNEACKSAGNLSVLFVGSPSYRKGVDLLLDIFEDFEQRGFPITLTIIGGAVDASLEARAKRLSNVTRKTFVAQPSLFHEYAAHDCLVLPSRFDSFGMVVAEAMAVGTPALVSDHVGAKRIIEEHPDCGWVVPCEADALKAKLEWLHANRAVLPRASEAARLAAPSYSWQAYRARAMATLHHIRDRLQTGGVRG